VASPIDRAFVEILPDFSKFVNAFKKDIDKATSTLEDRFDRTFARVERMASQSARSIVGKFRDAFAQMAIEAEQAAERAEDSLRDIDPPPVDVEVDVDRRQVDDEVDSAVRRARPPDIPVNIDIDVDREGTFARFISSLTGIRLPIAGFAALGLVAASAAASMVQFAAAVAPAVGIVATLPSGIGLLAAGISTLRVATMGVGDAFAAAFEDAETFEAAMEGLAPNVQNAAQALRDMAPELDGLRDRVQQAFFQDFDDVLNSLAETLLGPVTDGMTSVAGAANSVIQSLTNVATSRQGVDFVTQSFAIMSSVIQQLQEPLTMLFDALLSVGIAINDAFGENVGSGLADLITQFAAFLQQAAASGEAVAWVENAMNVFRQLGAIISPIVGIFQSIGNAATVTGGNILGVWGEALGTINEFLASRDGQAALIAIFEALNTVGDAFRTVLAGIGPAIPPLVSGISNILSAVSPLLGPLSELVGSVLTALAPLLTAVATAITPIIGPLTTIIELLGPVLTDIIEALMPLIEVVAEVIGGVLGAAMTALAPIIIAVLDAVSPLLEALQPLFEVLGVIAEIVGTVLQPILTVLGDILLWIVNNIILPFVIPTVELLATIISTVLGAAIQWLVDRFQDAWLGIQVVWNLLKDLVTRNAEAMSEQWDNMVALFRAGWNILNNNVIQPLITGFNIVKNAAVNRINEIKNGFNTFVNFVKGIPGKVSGALGRIFDPLWNGFRSAINSVIRGWNNLSFTMPSVDLGPLGSTPSFSVSTPNIPQLAVGGLSMGEGLVNMHPNEAVLPLEDQRTTNLMTDAIAAAIANLGGFPGAGASTTGDITVRVYIDGQELNSRIDTRIDANNQTMLRRARSGTRRNH
jgi:phage-related protein